MRDPNRACVWAGAAATFSNVVVAPPEPIVVPEPFTLPDVAAAARRKGRLSGRLSPVRDLRAPFVFRMSGRLTLPVGVPTAAGCRGRVTLHVQRGPSTISSRQAWLTRACTYRVRIVFADRKRFRLSKRLRFTARFAGNTRVLPTTAAARLGRIRR